MPWPRVPYDEWKDTLDTLHMWMQVVGKVKLALAPFLNQWWEVAFYITSSGITTGPIPYQEEIFQADFDFIHHTFSLHTSTGKTKTILLQPRSVAIFYEECMETLQELGIQVTIWPVPVEVPDPIPFDKDTKHASYEKDYVTKWWHILVKTHIVFEQFRTSFRGKSSPVHFFWGSFDLSSTRFSGKKAIPPKMKGIMENIMKFSENEENFTFGFWPGDEKFPHPAFFSYAYPEPSGIIKAKFGKDITFNEQLRLCILPYDIVRKAKTPEKTLLHFLESTYTESTKLAGWDIQSLQAEVPNLKR